MNEKKTIGNVRKKIEEFSEKTTSLTKYFNVEFGEVLYSNKLILKTVSCGKKDCKFCPHGPYWYRAVFNPKTKKWIFKYITSDLKRGTLKNAEIPKWNRYKFFNEEAKRIRRERRKVLREKS